MARQLETEVGFKYNIVVLGKTGVGKSSLINYLYGKNARKSSAGKPVTGKGFEKISLEINNLETNVYDSWGIEAKVADKWKKILDKELKKRDISSDVKDWFHTIFYCFSAGSARIEDFEIDLINKFIEKKYYVNIIFTKADQATEDEIIKMKETLYGELKVKLPVILVCNETKELMGGNKVEQFGKEKVEKAIAQSLWDSIALRLPKRCTNELSSRLNNWYERQVNYIENNYKIYNQKKIAGEIKREIENYVDKLDKKIVPEVVYRELEEILCIYNQISSNYAKDNKVYKNFIPSLEELIAFLRNSNQHEYNAFADILKIAFKAGGGVFAIKGLGLLLLFKIPVFLPAAIAGIFLAFKEKEKNKQKLIDHLIELKDKFEMGFGELEFELEKMFIDIKDYYLEENLLVDNMNFY